MSFITPSNTTDRAARADLRGMRMRVFRFVSVGTGDSWVSGMKQPVAFATSENAKSLRVDYDADLTEFTFTVAAGPALDLDLYVWGSDN